MVRDSDEFYRGRKLELVLHMWVSSKLVRCLMGSGLQCIPSGVLLQIYKSHVSCNPFSIPLE